jgi:hypothetical protein
MARGKKHTPQQSGPQNHTPAQLRHQPAPATADREGIRMAQADRPVAAGKVARVGERGPAVRLQLRHAQPDPAS